MHSHASYIKFGDAGTDEKKVNELNTILDKFYDDNIKDATINFPEFYRGVCEIVEYLPFSN